jgi:hypothetical protein
VDVGKREDQLLDYVSSLLAAQDDAITIICRIILANPQLDADLSRVVQRLGGAR